jgi:LPS sulfotransferase NodH
MSNNLDILIHLNEHAPDVYPDKSIHSIEIEAAMPVWDKPGDDDFRTMIKKRINVVFVCFVNRSGSNYLLDLIQQLDLGAKPTDEAFNYDQVIARCRKNDIGSFAGYLARIIIANSRDGFCFLKIGGEQLFWLTRHGFLSRMMDDGNSPKFVIMSRGDKVAQAVSLFIAEATGQFSESKSEHARDPEHQISVEYDAAKILDRLRYVDYQEHLFSLFFAVHGLNYLPVQYEALLVDPKTVLGNVLRYVGALNSTIARLALIETEGKTLVRQGGELNRNLVERFRNDFRIGAHVDEPISEPRSVSCE